MNMDPPQQQQEQLNADVLRRIFNRLGLKDLETCRLVCKDWQVEANQVVRKKTHIRLPDEDFASNVQRFLSDMDNTTDFPFENFALNLWNADVLENFDDCDEMVNSIHPLIIDLLMAWGTEIKGWTSDCADFVETTRKEKFRKYFINALPGLETLSLERFPSRGLSTNSMFASGKNDSGDVFPNVRNLQISQTEGNLKQQSRRRCDQQIIIQDILSMCPNLESIMIKAGQRYSLIPSAISAFSTLKCAANSIPHLRKLHLECPVNNADLETLHKFGFQLLEFSLHQVHTNVSNHILEDIFKSQRKSLQVLSLGGPYFQTETMSPILASSIFSTFPKMEVLEALNFGLPDEPCRKFALPPNGFQKCFPRLKTLCFGGKFSDVFPPIAEANTTLRELIIIRLSTPENIVSLESHLTSFQMLRALKIEAPDPKLLKCVWKCCINLKELHLNRVGLYKLCYAFCGIPRRVSDLLEAVPSFSVDENFVKALHKEKSLGDMANLRHLTLSFQSTTAKLAKYCGFDTVLYLELPKLKNLTSLDIQNYSMSNGCHRWISDKFSGMTCNIPPLLPSPVQMHLDDWGDDWD